MTTITLLSESDLIKASLPLDDMLVLVKQTYLLQTQKQIDVPLKIGVHPNRPNSFLHAMPAWVNGPQPALGMKWVAYYPGNAEHGLPDSTGVIFLNDPDTGQPVCMMEGMYITFLRTAACAAIAAKHLVKSPGTLGLVGCGGLGQWSLTFLRHTFPSLKTVKVASRHKASREAFCHTHSNAQCQVVPVNNTAEAITECDIVVTSVPPTNAPPVTPGLLGKHALFIPLDVVNSWCPSTLEEFQHFVVDSPEGFTQRVALKTGTEPLNEASILSTQNMIAGHTARGPVKGPAFIGVCGIASIDMAFAQAMLKRATSLGLGTNYRIR